MAAVVGAAAACSTTPSTSTTTSTTTVSGTTSTSTASSTTTTTSPPVTTTTAPAIPTGLQSSADNAASALVSAWAAGNQARALSVATAQAVNTLFAVKYPGGLAISRGCSSSFSPIVCTYGPPGGGPTNAPIYQIYSVQVSGGWYVTSVQIEQ
jgi:hypothetical protein